MSNFSREVITLQLGHYSNFVGTHWWNLQDASLSYDPETPPSEIQSDVLFREGQTPGGHVTHTPRLISMDLKGSLRTLRQEGSLYDAGKDTSAATWEGSLMMHKESPAEKNSFLEDLDKLDKGEVLAEDNFYSSPLPQRSAGAVSVETVNSQLARVQKGYRLEGSVKVWSDFLRIHLHPRTVSVIHQYNHDGEAHRLEAFGQGDALLQCSVLEQLEDKLHFFVEECDYLQGFQVFCDLADGFAGLGSKVTEMLQDSYGGRGILTWGMAPVSHPDTTPMKELYHVLNCALGTVNMAAHSSFFCPLTLRGGLGRRPSAPVAFPHLNYDPSLWYHSSSVLALALDALTLPYRLKNNGSPMWQVADSLSVSGRKVVAAYGAVPFPMMHGGTLPDALSACADKLPWKPLSACTELGDGRCFGQWATLKGFEGQRLTRDSASHSSARPPQRGGRPGLLHPIFLSYVSSGSTVGVYTQCADATVPSDIQPVAQRSGFPAEPESSAWLSGPHGLLRAHHDVPPVGSRSWLVAVRAASRRRCPGHPPRGSQLPLPGARNGRLQGGPGGAAPAGPLLPRRDDALLLRRGRRLTLTDSLMDRSG
ncbi:protein misato homolog 1 isoform 1-T1 [Lycodopsis pacificus]